MIHLQGVMTAATSKKCVDDGIPTARQIQAALMRDELFDVRLIGSPVGLPTDQPNHLRRILHMIGPFQLDVLAHGDGDGGPVTIARITVTGTKQGQLMGMVQ